MEEGEGVRGCSAAGRQPRAAPGPPPNPSPLGHHHLPRPATSSLLAPARRPPQRTSYRAPRPLPGQLGGGGDPHYTGARAERAGEVGLASALPNQRGCRCRPLPSPCAPARGPGLRAGPAARAGPEAGSPGASRASPECRGLRASPAAPGPGRGLSDRPASPVRVRVSPGLHLRLQPGLPIHWAPALSPLGSARGQGNPPPCRTAHLGAWAGVFEASDPEQARPQVNPGPAAPQTHTTTTTDQAEQETKWRQQPGSASPSQARAAPGLPPAAGSTPARQGVGFSGAPRAAAPEQRRRAEGSALRSPQPLTHHPSPSPSPHASSSPCPAVRGERLRGAGSGYPPGHCPPGRGLGRGMRPGNPSAEPTPRTRARLQPDSAPAPRPVAVRSPPGEAESPARAPRERSSRTHAGARGSSLPRAGRGERGGRGPLIPAPPPAPSLGLGLAPGLGQWALAGVGRCVHAGLGAGRGRASHRRRCSSPGPGRWPSLATAVRRRPPAPLPGSPGSARIAPASRAAGPGRSCAGKTDRWPAPPSLRVRPRDRGSLISGMWDLMACTQRQGPVAPTSRSHGASNPQRQRKDRLRNPSQA
ncbi:basic proline-rich protein-like [Lepus europaeus]|uniref:basic proline-rich protein-like n=1 Tax=Lepus europaeus TaxID=9983 RepID=UPI002B483FA4|nr:basic proline-rich protein-like [Lepus europaeus]